MASTNLNASIGDRVWRDVNKNGLQDADEQGMAGITVKLLDRNNNVLALNITDSNGMYRFSNLTAGSYGLQFSAPTGYTFTNASMGSNRSLDSDVDSTGKTAFYTLAWNESNLSVDAGLVSNTVETQAINDFAYIQENTLELKDNVLTNDTGAQLRISAIRTGEEIAATGNNGTVGSALNGKYGSLTINADGSYRYVLNNAHPEVNGLQSGLALSDIFTYTAKNSQNRTDSAQLTINILGANDAPTLATIRPVAYVDTPTNDSFAVSKGTLLGSDVDTNSTLLSYGIHIPDVGYTQTKVGNYGTLTVDYRSGEWVYTPNVSAMNGVANGTVQDQFSMLVDDGSTFSTQPLIINLTAANDLPVLSKPSTASYTENASAVTLGSGLNISDSDETQISSARITISSGLSTGDVLNFNPISNAWSMGGTSDFIQADNRKDIAYDAKRGVLYISGDDTVRRYDMKSHSFLSPIQLGGKTMGMDISPDGKTLAVANNTHTDKQSYFDLINLDNNQPSRVNFNRDYMDGGTYSVAYDQQGKLLVSSSFEGSGWVQLRKYDPVSHEMASLGNIRQDSMLSASADRRVIGIEESNISDGKWGTYRVGDTSYVSQHQWYEPITGGTSTFNFEIGVSRDGSQVAIPTYQGTFIGTPQDASKVIGKPAGETPIGVAYSPTSDVVFFPFSNTNQIIGYNTNTLTEIGRINVQGQFDWVNWGYIEGRSKVASDNAYLFSTVDSGISITSLSPISGQYDSKTGVLSLSGVASLSAYQTILRSISYNSTSNDPTANSASRTISWSVTDAHSGQSTTQTSILNITAVNDPPTLTVTGTTYTDTAVQDSFNPHTGTAVGRDVDNHAALVYGLIDGTRANLTSVTGSYGSLTINPSTGAYTYTPNASAINALTGNATDEFTVMVSDELTNTNARYTVNVKGANDAPIATNDQINTDINTASNLSVSALLGNDRDVDTGSSFSHIVINRLPTTASGALMLNNQAVTANQTISLADLTANKLRFVPANNYAGKADFGYQVSDGTLLSNSATVSINISSSDDYSNNVQTTGRISINGNQTGNIETALDKDWFKIDLTAGKTYRIKMEGITLTDTFIQGIYTKTGSAIANTSNDDAMGSLNSQVSFTPTETGSYFIEAGAYAKLTGTYRLSVAEVANAGPDDYANTIATTGKIAAGQSQKGNIETALDVDWFKATLLAGHSYRINLEGLPTAAGTLQDTYLKGIFDRAGIAIANTSNDDSSGSLNSQVLFTPTASGDYFIAAGAYASHTGTYKLSLTDLLDSGNNMDQLLGGTSTIANNNPANTNLVTPQANEMLANILDQMSRSIERAVV